MLAISLIQNKEHYGKANFIEGTGRTKFSWTCLGKTVCILEKLNYQQIFLG